MIYKVRVEAAAMFTSTPYVFTPGTGKGGPIFDAARKAGLPYLKYEKGFSYGFPGTAVMLFNSSLMALPSVIYHID